MRRTYPTAAVPAAPADTLEHVGRSEIKMREIPKEGGRLVTLTSGRNATLP